MKKKLLSLAMAAIMVMGLSTTAFAADSPAATTATTVTVTKTYTATNGGTSPAETFSFTVEKVNVEDSSITSTKDMPTVSVDDIKVVSGAATETGASLTMTINLPSYSAVGVYTYKITEDDGNYAGVTYSEEELYLVVYVTNVLDSDGNPTGALTITTDIREESTSGSKTDGIENKYEAGALSVTKDVTGNLGDTEKEFSFTVTFAAPTTGETVDWSLVTGSVAGSTVDLGLTSENLTYTFSLSDGETAKFDNLPYGVTYEVVETDANTDDYTTTYDGRKEGTINSESTSTTIENKKEQTVDTGVILDSAPYIMILALVLLGAAYVISRRRLSDRY